MLLSLPGGGEALPSPAPGTPGAKASPRRRVQACTFIETGGAVAVLEGHLALLVSVNLTLKLTQS